MTGLLTFYSARLRQASLPELCFRVRTMLYGWWSRQLVRRGKLPCRIPPVPSHASVMGLLLPRLKRDQSQVELCSIIAGQRFTHGTDPVTLQAWERALISEKPVAGQAAADIRTVWEPARLQHLTIALAMLSRGESPAASESLEQFVEREVTAWLKANPFLTGLQYRSAMECGLRIPVFMYCLRLLSGLDAETRELLGTAVFLHAWWIERNLSLYSSRGNHTVCEACGLVFAGALYRDTERGHRWLEKGIRLLRRELSEQVLADGGPVEQSFSYHRFVLDIYWLTLDLLEQNNLHQTRDMLPRLLEGERFLSSVSFAKGQFPAVGDSDDGHAVAPGVIPHRGEVQHADQDYRTFPQAGYTVIRGVNGFFLLFDHGPLGMPPLYNHGHADALSVTLALGDEELLVDPGTFRYNGVPRERAYFKSTSAHNTVVVDGFDQAEQITGFIWEMPYQSRLLRQEQIDNGRVFEAEHTGYRRLKQPVVHNRRLVYTPQESLLIKDTFSGKGTHDFSVQFCLHPEAHVNQEDGWWRIERAGGAIRLKLLDGYEFELLQGEENPLAGWYSPAYGSKVAAPLLRCRRTGDCASVIFRTYIRLRLLY